MSRVERCFAFAMSGRQVLQCLGVMYHVVEHHASSLPALFGLTVLLILSVVSLAGLVTRRFSLLVFTMLTSVLFLGLDCATFEIAYNYDMSACKKNCEVEAVQRHFALLVLPPFIMIQFAVFWTVTNHLVKALFNLSRDPLPF